MQEENELINQLKKLNRNLENHNKINILKVGDVAQILKINKNQASKLFKRSDFPALVNCGDNKIEETALYNWLQKRHDDNKYIDEDYEEDEENY